MGRRRLTRLSFPLLLMLCRSAGVYLGESQKGQEAPLNETTVEYGQPEG